MKKTLLLLSAILLTLSSFAQKDSRYVGGNLIFGGALNSAGIGIKGLYQFEKEWRGEAGLNLYPGSSIGMWEIYGNAHYLFPIADKFNVYPLAGLGLSFWSFDVPNGVNIDKMTYTTRRETRMRLGITLGVGGEYQLNNRWLLQAELKAQMISDYNQGVLSLGAAYRF